MPSMECKRFLFDVSIDRRKFLGGCLAAGAVSALPTRLVRGEAAASVSGDKLQLAIIGCGGRGRDNMAGVSSERIVALCDTNPEAIAAAKSLHPDAKTVQDWRELVDDPRIDGFIVSTADHHHAPISLAAMQAGKHVYCEKPLAHTVYEARQMQEAYRANRGKIATQMGTQIHAEENYRRVVELVQSGMIGDVTEAHVWCDRGIQPVEPAVLSAQPITPKGFAWDVWLGPADERAYHEDYWRGGNLNWNRRWEFGNGVLGDMGSHLIDLPFWALELSHPEMIASEGPDPSEVACPPWQQVTWHHPARPGGGPHRAGCKVVWYHGQEGMKRRAALLQPMVGDDTDINQWGIGVAFVGKEGVVVADYGRIVLSPSSRFAAESRPEQTIPRSLGHYQEWIHAAKTGGETLCNFDYSGALIEHNLLGNVAHRLGKQLQWDAAAVAVVGDPAADRYLTKTYRDEWKPAALIAKNAS